MVVTSQSAAQKDWSPGSESRPPALPLPSLPRVAVPANLPVSHCSVRFGFGLVFSGLVKDVRAASRQRNDSVNSVVDEFRLNLFSVMWGKNHQRHGKIEEKLSETHPLYSSPLCEMN